MTSGEGDEEEVNRQRRRRGQQRLNLKAFYGSKFAPDAIMAILVLCKSIKFVFFSPTGGETQVFVRGHVQMAAFFGLKSLDLPLININKKYMNVSQKRGPGHNMDAWDGTLQRF